MTAPHLSVVPPTASAQDRRPRQHDTHARRDRSPFLDDSGLIVTATNAVARTVRIMPSAYYRFRDVALERALVLEEDKRPRVLAELLKSFAVAVPRRTRDGWRLDRDGNLILIDDEEQIMFIVSRDGVLRAAFDCGDRKES